MKNEVRNLPNNDFEVLHPEKSVEAIAIVIPLDEADEATVDALIKRRLSETKVRRLSYP